ncbi:hypothetical protein SAMN05660742_111154 [Propionispira arboris]|uniref:Uncharacterized protein n=1 Tax=Propionispira arboris TaxID=84035 RepID=A0A1H7A5F7_9FIRM|nr:hypothetical protein [Propionispira arboris]SEJ60658.1 hypothetical protein SAMN05660742_111154 [Propionispira arboris]
MNRCTRRKALKNLEHNLSKYTWEKQKYAMFSILLRDNKEKMEESVLFFNKNKIIKNNINRFFFSQNIKDLLTYELQFNELSEYENIEKLCVTLLCGFTERLEKYIKLKKLYEREVFSEKYSDAYTILVEIEKNCGISIWSCGQKLLLAESIGGLEENKKELESFFSGIQPNEFARILLIFSSYRAERNMSFINYQEHIKNFVKVLNESSTQVSIKNYFLFKIGLDRIDLSLKDMCFILQLDAQMSIVDLYNSYVELLQCMCVNEKVSEIGKSFVLGMAKLQDTHISNMNIRLNFSANQLEDFVATKLCLIIEEYTLCHYNKVIDLINEDVKSNGIYDFQILILLIKSCINSKNEIPCNIKILHDIYNVYSINESYEFSLKNLNLYLKIYKDTSWKYKLLGFIDRKTNFVTDVKKQKLSLISDINLTPNFIFILNSDEERKEYLKIFLLHCKKTVDLYKKINGFKEWENEFCSEFRNEIYKSRYYIKNNESEIAISFLEKLIEKKLYTSDYEMEKIIKYLYLAYVSSNKLESAGELIVNSYFYNKNIIKRCNLSLMIDKKNMGGNVNLDGNISYPIYVYLYQKMDLKLQRIVLSNYLDFYNIDNVEDIIKKENTTNVNKLIFFLNNICTEYAIKREVRLATNSKEAMECRIKILRILCEIDKQNKKMYLGEINDITTRREVNERTKQISNRKIFADVKKIKLANEDVLKENFNKYIAMKSFQNDISEMDIEGKTSVQLLNNIVSNINKSMGEKPQYAQKVIVLRGILSKILEEFLRNEKYGMNTYLSSRIRHGYCDTQLTKMFRQKNLLLVSSTGENKKYNVSQYWDSKINETQEKDYRILKKSLSEFTLKIERKVSEIKTEWIQIKLYPNESGMFDYSNILNELTIYVNDFEKEGGKTFDMLFDSVINYIWSHTDSILEKIRCRLNDEVLKYYMDILKQLELNIKKMQDSTIKKIVEEITNNITLVKPKVEGAIQEFSNVFYKDDVEYQDFTMSELMMISTKILRNLYSNTENINFKNNIECKMKFSGVYFAYFIDIMMILFNNVMEHNGFDDLNNLKIEVSMSDEITEDDKKELHEVAPNNTEFNEKYLVIKMKNNFSKEIDSNNLEKKVREVLEEKAGSENNISQYTQIEGGTGLRKIKKTLSYDLGIQYAIRCFIDNREFEIKIYLCIENLIHKI